MYIIIVIIYRDHKGHELWKETSKKEKKTETNTKGISQDTLKVLLCLLEVDSVHSWQKM